MDNNVMTLIEELLVSNATLQQQAEAGEWDAFLKESAAYSMGMRTLCDTDLTQLAQHDKLQAATLIARLLESDTLLSRAIQNRMNAISAELAGMRKSSASAKAYTTV